MPDRPTPNPEREPGQPPPVLQQIGRDGKPIRAIAFAGGGFDTAMQLGVTHALLVSRARAPDVVIGCSAGAVNAVALAEVLQAGNWDQRVARFREIYDQYLKAPGTVFGATRPDIFQVDNQRPLESLKLPIHHELERDSRQAAVASRAGIINLYNTLLNIRVSIGTIARALRRWLGVQAAGNLQQPLLRALIVSGEWLRTWMLLGANVAKLAPLVGLLIDGAVHTKPKVDLGATAGALIFRSRLWTAVERIAHEWFGLLLCAALWLFGSIAVPALVGVAPVLLIELIPGGATVGLGGWTVPMAAVVGTAILALVIGVVGEPQPDESLDTWSETVGYLLGVAVRTLPRALWATFLYLLLVARWGTVVVLLAGAPLFVDLLVTALGPLPWTSSYAVQGFPWAISLGILTVAALIAGLTVARRRKTLGIGLLGLFRLDRSLLDPQPLRQLLISLFDPSYYGDILIDRSVESALRNKNNPVDCPRSEKYLQDYADVAKQPPIHVLVTVADVATADFDVLPGTYRVVDGLVAAMAAPPFFPPVSNGHRLFVDGAVVANDPARPLFRFLRRNGDGPAPLVNGKAAVLHLYSVSPLPLSRPILGREPDARRPERPREYTNLVDVTLRALDLQRFRDAKLERTLSELQTRAMPETGSLFYPENPGKDERRHVRTWVFPVEPENPLGANADLLNADSEARRREVIAETVAAGCRAALSVMMRQAVHDVGSVPAGTPPPEPPALPKRKVALCRQALAQHLRRLPVLPILPGSATAQGDSGPGLAEVCAHCVLFRPRHAGSGQTTSTTELPRPRSLVWERHQAEAPAWPIDDAAAPEPAWREPSHTKLVAYPNQKALWGERWPRPRLVDGTPAAPIDRPTVSFLFSGGVFRGVFQVGVLNGLSEAGLVPDVVAGASVGSITAAMVASAFLGEATIAAADRLTGRRAAVRRLAAAYLAIDRLVLTDRFADFIRGVTIRAAQARFSIRQADRVIRRFDDVNPWRWNRDVRSVVAGLERLVYVSPFELKELLEAFRRQQTGRIGELLREDLQEFLDRAGVGSEVLGAEPLALLVREYVLEALAPPPPAPRRKGQIDKLGFQEFLDRGLVFLATTTNLSEGRLEVLGEEQLFGVEGRNLTLLYALLASSAFPAVFRPRWEWEIRPHGGRWRQYIDGGVVDNLPLDAVAQFLNTASLSGLIERRPRAPHLVFSASLEPETQPITDDRDLDALQHNWPRLFRRARRLGYNKKLDMFTRTQQNLRAIMEARARAGDTGGYTPLDLWVTTVIPRWLCGTFAFHPMLGFRQWKQAASIAHGCASTLLALGREAAHPDGGDARAAAWAIDRALLPSPAQSTAKDSFVRLTSPAAKGNCWYRPTVPCPFSKEGQGERGSRRTGEALEAIYDRCGQIASHRPQ